ncbi:MAG: hypothetical protein ACOZCK_08025 [Pseudomonadota bacterium]
MSEGLTPEQRNQLGYTVTTVLAALGRQIDLFNEKAEKQDSTIRHALPGRDIQEECVKALSSQLSQHVEAYSICQTRIDFFKVAAWLGMMLYKRSSGSFLLYQLVAAMNAQLRKEQRQLSSDICKKIASMLKNDGQNDSIAIGMNGLYMIFRAASEVEGI